MELGEVEGSPPQAAAAPAAVPKGRGPAAKGGRVAAIVAAEPSTALTPSRPVARVSTAFKVGEVDVTGPSSLNWDYVFDV